MGADYVSVDGKIVIFEHGDDVHKYINSGHFKFGCSYYHDADVLVPNFRYSVGNGKIYQRSIVNQFSIYERKFDFPYVVINSQSPDRVERYLSVLRDKNWQNRIACEAVRSGSLVQEFDTSNIVEYKSISHNSSQNLLKEFRDESYGDRFIKSLTLNGQYRSEVVSSAKKPVTVVIPTANCELVIECLSHLSKCVSDIDRIIVVSNGAGDEPLSGLSSEYSAIHDLADVVVYDGEFNYSKIHNWVIDNYISCDQGYCLLLNDDVNVLNGSYVSQILSVAELTGSGIVGNALYYPGDQYDEDRFRTKCHYQHCGITSNQRKTAFDHYQRHKYVSTHYMPTRRVGLVTFASALIRNDVLKSVKFDERYFGNCSDIDFCARAALEGVETWYCSTAEAVHHESKTRSGNPVKDECAYEYYQDDKNNVQKLCGIV